MKKLMTRVLTTILATIIISVPSSAAPENNSDAIRRWGGNFSGCNGNVKYVEFNDGIISDSGHYNGEIAVDSKKANQIMSKYNIEYFVNGNWYDRELEERQFNKALDVIDKGFSVYGKDTISALSKYHPMHVNVNVEGKTEIQFVNDTCPPKPTTASFNGGVWRYMRDGEDFRVVNASLTLSPNEDLDINDVIEGFSITIVDYLMVNTGNMDVDYIAVPNWMINPETGKKYLPTSMEYHMSNALTNAMINGSSNRPASGTLEYKKVQWLYQMSLSTFGADNNMTKRLASNLGF